MVVTPWRDPPHHVPDDVTRSQGQGPPPHDQGIPSHHSSMTQPPLPQQVDSHIPHHVPPPLSTTPHGPPPQSLGDIPCNGPPQTPTTPGGGSVVSDGSLATSLGGGEVSSSRPHQNGNAGSSSGEKTHIECVVSYDFCHHYSIMF